MRLCECPVCGSKVEAQLDGNRVLTFYDCPVCGRYELNECEGTERFNINHLYSYLIYHAFYTSDYSERRYHTVLGKDECDRYKKDFENGHKEHGLPVHMDSDIVDAWYPRTLSEKVDCFLRYFDSHTRHFGQKIELSFSMLVGLLFVDRYDIDKKEYRDKIGNCGIRSDHECLEEVRYMME